MFRLTSLYRRMNSSIFLRDLRFKVSFKLKKCLKMLRPRRSKAHTDKSVQSGSVDPEYIVTIDW